MLLFKLMLMSNKSFRCSWDFGSLFLSDSVFYVLMCIFSFLVVPLHTLDLLGFHITADQGTYVQAAFNTEELSDLTHCSVHSSSTVSFHLLLWWDFWHVLRLRYWTLLWPKHSGMWNCFTVPLWYSLLCLCTTCMDAVSLQQRDWTLLLLWCHSASLHICRPGWVSTPLHTHVTYVHTVSILLQ